ncbi:MAG: ribulose-phosphate 3-epimerase [Clostridia bacterium]|nr:ribulose-phosphate 3-epimerase [Clostridia bacterium]
MIKISPSILASDFANLQRDIEKVEKAGVEYLHIDVMDGIFVPNITIGPPVIKAIRKHSDLIFDVHLMITDPIRYIEDFAAAGADLITIHHESCDNQIETLKKIHLLGKKTGISIKPKTDPKVLDAYLEYADLILIMTVEPGFGGQSFIPDTLKSVKYAKALVDSNNKNIEIEVDGGISPANSALVTSAGANVIVAGSAIFGSADIPGTVAALKR